MPPRNLVNLNAVGKEQAARTILANLTLGVQEHDRIGVVGANGAGKSTLLGLIGGSVEADSGAVIRARDLHSELLDQRDRLYHLDATHPHSGERLAAGTVADAVIGGRAEHEWAADARFRAVLDGLLGGVSFTSFAQGAQTRVENLSGGERRRVALAQALTAQPSLLLLDEPTNHLDVEAISWLASYLASSSGALLVVTHDRWFLDAVCTDTWEVADRAVHRYEGGYSAYVLAKAERERIAAAREERRLQLVRKELAWLRRGPPARTAKPKFRIEAANALIADEPPARDSTELLRFASRRLGSKVIEASKISFGYAPDQQLIHNLTWLLGPGDRLALVGVNGSGKSTLLGLLAGELTPRSGTIEHGTTVQIAHLSQSATELPEALSVLDAVQEIARYLTLADGSQLTASRMVERLGFRGDRARVPVAELSGGERRRLALARLLMSEPNVLILDEPTNDLDIETLTALEDLLDHWAGTLLVVSHDRYFVQRVCDNVYALDPLGGIRHLPGGIEQYLSEVTAPGSLPSAAPGAAPAGAAPGRTGQAAAKPGSQLREARKALTRLDRELERISEREAELHHEMAAAATDHQLLSRLTSELQALTADRDELEAQWLEAAELVEGNSPGG